MNCACYLHYLGRARKAKGVKMLMCVLVRVEGPGVRFALCLWREEQRNLHIAVSPWFWGKWHTYIPGTSSVSLSCKIPRLHFGGFRWFTAAAFESSVETESWCFASPSGVV
jgi:hypothetical protein